MAHYEYPNAILYLSIDHRVRVANKRKRTPSIPRRRTEAGIGLKEFRDTSKLLEKPASDTSPDFDLVVVKRLGEVGIRLAME